MTQARTTRTRLIRPLLTLLSIYVLGMGIFGLAGVLDDAGRPSLGVYTYWSAAEECVLVDALTPVSWPAIAGGLLRPGDCIVAVAGLSTTDPGTEDAITAVLRQRVENPAAERSIPVDIRRGGTVTVVDLPVFRLTISHLLQTHLALFLTGLTLWLLGTLGTVSDSGVEAGWALALACLASALYAFGSQHLFSDAVGRWFTAGTVVLARPFIGAALLHLAIIFPAANPGSIIYRLRFAPYGIATVSLLLHESVMVFLTSGAGWLGPVANATFVLDAVMIALGLLLLIFKSVTIARDKHASLRAQRQAWLLVVAWLVLIPFFLAWWLGTVSTIEMLLMPIIAVAILVYSVLRYQSFRYRATIVPAVAIIMTSALLAAVLLLAGSLLFRWRVDGIQLLIVWSTTLLTTLFWYARGPLTSGFRRLFFRDTDNYRIARDYALALGQHKTPESACLFTGLFLQSRMELAWAAVGIGNRVLIANPNGADWYSPETSAPQLATAVFRTALPADFGHIWCGARITAEPFDQHDRELTGLVAQHLTQKLIILKQIAELEQVPLIVLNALDEERNRIATDVHDTTLQFLGALPFLLAQLKRSAADEATVELLDTTQRRVAQATDELRRILHQVEPPFFDTLADFLLFIQDYVELACGEVGLAVDLDLLVDAHEPLDDSMRLNLYYIIREATTNAIKHAEATHLTIRLHKIRPDRFELGVADNGRGFDPAAARSGKHGLMFLEQRVRLLSGNSQIVSSPGKGTQIRVVFPVSA